MNQILLPPIARQALRPPAETRRRLDRCSIDAKPGSGDRSRWPGISPSLNAYLEIAPQVTTALEQLNEQLFQQLLGTVQEKLTVALQEILEQPIVSQSRGRFKRGAATVEFWIERDGHAEDILRGQGGSVANILSVGLRMFALATLDERQHRRFLVLDEQDCWLRPDLVPRLVKIVHQASQALGFQVLMISHHDVAMFERYADRIYEFIPDGQGGVNVHLRADKPVTTDEEG